MTLIKELLQSGFDNLAVLMDMYSEDELVLVLNGAYVQKIAISEEHIDEVNKLISAVKGNLIKRFGDFFFMGFSIKYRINIKQKMGMPLVHIKFSIPLTQLKHVYSYTNLSGKTVTVRLTGNERYGIEILLNPLDRVAMFAFVFNMRPVFGIPEAGLLATEEHFKKVLASMDLYGKAGILKLLKENKDELIRMITGILEVG